VTLAAIAARAELLSERLASRPHDFDDAPVAQRIARWRERVGEESFEKRLALGGISASDLAPLLGDRRNPDAFPLPPWAHTLGAIIDFVRNEPRSTEPVGDVPFEAILRPIVAFARGGVIDSSAFAASASADLERLLLLRLSRVVAPSLLERFRATRVAGVALLQHFGIESAAGGDSAYRAFVDDTLSDGLASLFEMFPMLGRFTVTLVEQWIAAANELRTRFESDRGEIRGLFGTTGDVERIIAVDGEGPLSDPHDCGRTVLILELNADKGKGKVVYKPRAHAFEVAFNDVLTELNDLGAPHRWYTLKILARPRYAWVEYAGDVACSSADEVRGFYRAAGAQLFIIALLGANDCHFENVVAHGEHPIFVDMETLLVRNRGSERAVLIRSGFLPHWQCHRSSAVHANIGGLASVAGQVVQKVRWSDLHRDTMHVGLVDESLQGGRNLPLLGGERIAADPYAVEIADGFTETYRFFIRERERVRAALGRLRGVPSRWISRATADYYELLHESVAPAHLRSGIDWSIEVDRLSAAFFGSANALANWEAFTEERLALERLDIPYFTTRSDSTALFVEDREVLEWADSTTAFGDLMSRLDNLSEDDLAFQAEIIAVSFDAPMNRNGLKRNDRSAPVDGDFIGEAKRIGDEIVSRAIPDVDGLTWVGLSFEHGDVRQLDLLGGSFYKGRRGIALFLAALAAETGESHYADAARAAARYAGRGSDSLGIDGNTASAVYAFTRMAGLLGDEALLEDARRAADSITEDVIAADESYDVMGGCAGALLALSVLHGAAPSRELAARIAACARKLVDAPLRLTGFSHGAAGIALALHRAASITGDETFASAMRRCVAWETSHYLEEHRNWRDLRGNIRDGKGATMTSWCHGAPGIALSRIAAGIDDERLDAALDTTLDCGTETFDHLCCGNFGRVEVLLVASRARPGLRVEAASRAGALVSRAAREGSYRTSSRAGGGSVFFDPVFFQGMSGIGYQLLRLMRPDAYPSLIALE
jgi:type 2 lantibiotic biosynthesis protein LanM